MPSQKVPYDVTMCHDLKVPHPLSATTLEAKLQACESFGGAGHGILTLADKQDISEIMSYLTPGI